MPKNSKKKSLGSWPDNKKHQNTKSPQREDEEGKFGHMSNPEEVEGQDTLETAQDMGLYTEADEEHPEDINIGEEIDELEDRTKPGHGSE